MKILSNPYFDHGLDLSPAIMPSQDKEAPFALIKKCPDYAPTDLRVRDNLYIKDERTRMGLGAFKATGAAYVIAAQAQEQDLQNVTYVTASAGNHGLSVAVGARVFGAKSVVYLSKTVPSEFAQRLRDEGAQVIIEGEDYQASMDAALNAANDNGWVLLSDSSWEGYFELPRKLMEGYLIMGAEISEQIPAPPTHIFLQAGVGGMASAMAAFARLEWGNDPRIIIVEPSEAPALYQAIKAGQIVDSTGGVSSMGRLDCKTASHIALNGLSKHANDFVLIDDEDVEAQLPKIQEMGFETSPSGGAGLACYLALTTEERLELCINEYSKILFIISEAAS